MPARHPSLHAPAVGRALGAIARHRVPPEAIDRAILAAINVGLCLRSGGSARVAAGFNDDIARNGRRIGRR